MEMRNWRLIWIGSRNAVCMPLNGCNASR